MAITRSVLRFSSLILLITTLAAGTLCADNTQAAALLNQGRVDEAAFVLKETVATQPHDAEVHELLCRVYYAQDMADAAVPECERATGDDPSNSNYQMWLGRAYGLKASQANMISAFGIAKKVATAFERAVALDSTNVAAMGDLGQFYVNAPGIVGGGVDKAQTLAPRLLARSPAKGHRLLAQIAQKRNDLTTAEEEFKNAIAAGKSPEAWIDLAIFYQQHSQPDKAVLAVQSSIDVNRTKNAALYDAASILIELHRQPELAERCLREYLASSAKSDEAPAFKARMLLGNLLKQRGDSQGAQREYATALSLASKYSPAQKATQGA